MRWFSRATSGLPFADRDEAGRRLADHLAGHDEASLPTAGAIVLGIPRGGVPVAAAIARTLALPLDVVVAHKLGAPGEPELAIGAVAADGTVLIEPWSQGIVGDDDGYLRRAADEEIARARRREVALRRGRPALDLHGRTAIIVDDGIATGATMHVAVLAARAAGANRVIVASPVGASDSVATLRAVADHVVVLAMPEPFYAVGEFYARFDQTGDEEVAALLAEGAGRAERGGRAEGAGGGPPDPDRSKESSR